MTYNDFINKVSALLLYDTDNPDVESDNYINQLVRSWMSEMQFYVDNFKVKNENTYTETDFTVECEGARLTLPTELEKLVKVEFQYPEDRSEEDLTDCKEVIDMKPIAWDKRNDLVNPELNRRQCYAYAIDKRATEIYVYPYPRDDATDGAESIVVTWEGVKQDYQGTDEVPFGFDTIKNCADYVNAELARKKEDKLQRYNSFYESYLRGRLPIYRAQLDKDQQRA
jgi:hypothetical protein